MKFPWRSMPFVGNAIREAERAATKRAAQHACRVCCEFKHGTLGLMIAFKVGGVVVEDDGMHFPDECEMFVGRQPASMV